MAVLSPAQSLKQQFELRVLELKYAGSQVRDIELDEDVQRIGFSLWGATAFQRILREEIRRVIQNDIDEATGKHKWVSVRQQEPLPMPIPEAEVPSDKVPSRGEFLSHTYEREADVNRDPEMSLSVVEDLFKVFWGHIKKNPVLLPEEKDRLSKAFKKTVEGVRLRLAVNQ